MKTWALFLATVLFIASGVLVFRVVGGCANWQQQYRRFLYAEMMKNSPHIYTPEMIEKVIGEPPEGCDRPGPGFSRETLDAFRREGVGPNEFSEEIQAAL